MKKANGGNVGSLQNVALRRRDVGNNIPQFSPPSIPKLPSWLPRPKSCEQCRDWAKHLIIHVIDKDGPAFAVCRACYFSVANREEAVAVRQQFQALFAHLRPRLATGGALEGLLAQIWVLAYLNEDYSDELALARAVARSMERSARYDQ